MRFTFCFNTRVGVFQLIAAPLINGRIEEGLETRL